MFHVATSAKPAYLQGLAVVVVVHFLGWCPAGLAGLPLELSSAKVDVGVGAGVGAFSGLPLERLAVVPHPLGSAGFAPALALGSGVGLAFRAGLIVHGYSVLQERPEAYWNGGF